MVLDQTCQPKATVNSKRSSISMLVSSCSFSFLLFISCFICFVTAEVRDKVSALTTHKTIVKKKKLRSRQKKLKTYDLSTLTEFLPKLKGEQKPAPPSDLKRNCKSMRKLIWKEGKQLTTVLNHPAFQSDALAAIHQHIQRTQPVREEEKPEKRKNKCGSKKRKGGSKKEGSSVPQSMEM